MMDVTSRFSATSSDDSCEPDVIIDKVTEIWLSPFGPPKVFLIYEDININYQDF